VRLTPILILLIVPLLLAPALFVNSYSEEIPSRDDIKKLKKKIVSFQNHIDDIKIEIAEQKTEISKNESQLQTDKNKLKSLKQSSSTSWTHLENIINTENQIPKSKLTLSNSKKTLIGLENKLQIRIHTIENIKDDIDKAEKMIKLQPPIKKELVEIDNSNLVKKIGVKLSNTCITALKNNVTNPCNVSYKNLVILDSSNTDISGKFNTDDNGFFHRGKPQMQDSHRWYDLDNELRLFVDPPREMETRIKMIEISPNFNTYTLNSDKIQHEEYEYKDFEIFSILKNQTETISVRVLVQEPGRILFHDRYIDDYCRKSIISSDNWKFLLLDTINHMRNNCSESSTSFNNTEFIPTIKTEYNPEDSPSWKALQWFEESKIRCKTLCFSN